MAVSLSRRGFMALGCSAAASPLLTPVTLAAAPWEQRLVVIILRGAMDGLDVVQPYGDPALAALRSNLPTGEAGGALDLDGFYALHPALADLMPMWQAGELGFAHAVSTPYRDKRSHFDGQDLLEAGTGFAEGTHVIKDGWLNRLLQVSPGVASETAYSVGQGEMLILSGQAQAASWAPDTDLALTPQTRDLMRLVASSDPLFADALGDAVQIVDSLEDDPETAMMAGGKAAPGHTKLAQFTASRLRGGTRIASFSLGGWDTHNRQIGRIKPPLKALSDVMLTLKAELGPIWGQTAVVCMTEFGRTARENGTGGTDHGTGGAMVMAGGALRGGKVYGQWPGLETRDLYRNRDLMPTADVRAYAASAMRGLFGLPHDVLQQVVFPGLDMGAVPQVTL